ncbi:MAG: nuclear transport factor 2 family protein [Actinomycetes bacterium]
MTADASGMTDAATAHVGYGASAGTRRGLASWHEVVDSRDPQRLADVLADSVVFRSPIVHTPQRGRELTTLYLTGAMVVLGNDTFSYVREVADGSTAILEFTSDIDGITVNGVDMIEFDADGRIVDFKVMLRPMKAITLVGQKMSEMLAALTEAP